MLDEAVFTDGFVQNSIYETNTLFKLVTHQGAQLKLNCHIIFEL